MNATDPRPAAALATKSVAILELTLALRECVEWIEQVGCEALRKEDYEMLADAKAAVARAKEAGE